MKSISFVRQGLRIERITPHEGPSPVFNAWRPNRSQCFTDTTELIRFCKWPKSTPTGQELRDWIDSFEIDTAKATSQNELDPTADTKVII